MKKLTKHIWFEGELWKVEQILHPTNFDTYILVSKKDTEQAVGHSRGKPIHPIDMILIDCSSMEFYPDTNNVRDIMKSTKIQEEKTDQIKKRYSGFLTQVWLSHIT